MNQCLADTAAVVIISSYYRVGKRGGLKTVCKQDVWVYVIAGSSVSLSPTTQHHRTLHHWRTRVSKGTPSWWKESEQEVPSALLGSRTLSTEYVCACVWRVEGIYKRKERNVRAGCSNDGSEVALLPEPGP